MTLYDEQKIVQTAMNHSLSGLQADPWLTRRVLEKAKGENEPVKRKLSALVIIAIVVLIVTVTGALAAVLNACGILDFAGNFSDSYVPEHAADAITHEDKRIETEHLVCTLTESFYDGRLLYLTTHIEPKENVLLIFGSESPADPLEGMDPVSAAENRTIGEYALEKYDGRMAEVAVGHLSESMENHKRLDDGSAILYTVFDFQDEQPERSLQLYLSYLPLNDVAALSGQELDSGNVQRYDFDAMERTEIPLTVRAADIQRFVCDEPLPFPSVGVQVTKVLLHATPFELRYEIQFTVTDLEKYRVQEDWLWFEFIDSSGTETEYAAQRVSDGMCGLGGISRMDGKAFSEPVVGTVYRQTGSIGLNAQSDRYTLRAYNAWEKTRYEAVQFQVQEE